MADKLIPLTLPPGLWKNGTRYEAKNRWYDANLVRFIDGTKQPIGGWRRAQDDAGADLAALVGTPRGATAWRSDSGDAFIAVGTTSKLYVLAGGILRDITPVGFTVGRVDTGYVATAGEYNSGAYGSGVYGAGSLASRFLEADSWQLDTFGAFLVGLSTSDGKLYVWQGDPGTPAAQAAGSPTGRAAVCTLERFLVVLGAGGNVRKVAWASQETITDWTPTATNTAGDFELSTNGRLVCGRRTKNETLLFTDADMHRMQYIGGQYVYRFDQAGDKCGIIAPNAVAMLDTQAIWMGRDNFFIYDGFVRPLPCDVRDHVFGDFNQAQVAKVHAHTISEFGEVWWHYCSASSTEVDRYVVYNFRENHWTVGRMRRSAGIDGGATTFPVLVSPDGVIYEHEVLDHRPGDTGDPGLADGTFFADSDGFAGDDNPSLEEPYLESGPIELGEGDNVMRVKRLVPDEKTLGDVKMTLFSALYPTEDETVHGPYTAANPTDVRLTARQIRVRFQQDRETSWRVGTPRVGVSKGGRR